MSAIDIVRAVMDGDFETAKDECQMELDARRDELVTQGTDYIMSSLEDDINPDVDVIDVEDDYDY